MLTYDRRATPALLEALGPGGFAHSLVEYGRSGQYALDLQFRGYAAGSGKGGRHWATLYCGLTKVLDLQYLASRGFRLTAHPTWQVHGWDPAWASYARHGFDSRRWKAVEAYLERAIPAVGPRFLKEGAVQSAINAFGSTDLAVIDREVAVSFSRQSEKDRVCGELERSLLGALEMEGPGWWKSRPTHLGGECDALAIDTEGALVAIEIKPARASASIPWAPVQVRHYADLLGRWAAQDHGAAAEVVDEMMRQRVELGLTSGLARSCARPVRVRPMLAIQRGASRVVLDRLHRVRRRLEETGHDDPPLSVCQVNLVGRLDPLDEGPTR